MIKVAGVHKSYSFGNSSVPVLRGVDLHLPPGSFTALLGPSGCGKSTLLHLIGGLDRPDSGIIRVGGEAVDQLDYPSLVRYRASKIGYVFQNANLLPTLTARENVEVALLGVSDGPKRAGDLLTAVGLTDRLNYFPDQLSGGQRQRVALARALARRPPVVLADEPTGNLDQKTGRAVLELMVWLRREAGTTLLVVTHDPEVAAQADRVVRMVDGQVIG